MYNYENAYLQVDSLWCFAQKAGFKNPIGVTVVDAD